MCCAVLATKEFLFLLSHKSVGHTIRYDTRV